MKEKNYIPLNLYFCNQLLLPMSYLKSSLLQSVMQAAMAENDLDYPKLNVASIHDHYILKKIRVLKHTKYNLRLEFLLL